jgi:hypothetical protein
MIVISRAIYAGKKQVDQALQDNLPKQGGRSVRLSDVYDDAAEDDLPALLACLAKASSSIRRETDAIIRGLTKDYLGAWTISADAVFKVFSRLASLAGVYDDSDRWTEKQVRIEDDAFFRRFFLPVWPDLYQDWRSAINLPLEDRHRVPPELAAKVKRLFLLLGIRVLDEPIGMRMVDITQVDWDAAA